MKKKYIKLLLSVLLITTISAKVNAQDDLKKSRFSNQIKEYLMLEKFELTNLDIQNLYVDSEYLSKKTQLTHVYVGQQYNGVKIFNAISIIANCLDLSLISITASSLT